MKAWLLPVLTLLFAGMVACGHTESPSIALDDIVSAIQTIDSDFALDSEKPYYSWIGAEDGWMGYVDGRHLVKIYRFASAADAQAQEGMVANGVFALECNDETIRLVFSSLSP